MRIKSEILFVTRLQYIRLRQAIAIAGKGTVVRRRQAKGEYRSEVQRHPAPVTPSAASETLFYQQLAVYFVEILMSGLLHEWLSREQTDLNSPSFRNLWKGDDRRKLCLQQSLRMS